MSKSPKASAAGSSRPSGAEAIAARRQASASPLPDSSDANDDSAADEGESKRISPLRSDPKADNMMKEAEKKLSKGAFASLFSSSNKYEDAVELIKKAAAQYKVSKLCQYSHA